MRRFWLALAIGLAVPALASAESVKLRQSAATKTAAAKKAPAKKAPAKRRSKARPKQPAEKPAAEKNQKRPLP